MQPTQIRSATAEPLLLLGTTTRSLSQQYLSTARQTLRHLVDNPGWLVDIPLARPDHGYARTLVFGDGAVSVFAFAWAPGAATGIHDHHCSCCFGVVEGHMTELRFRTVDDDRVAIAARMQRDAGHVACMIPTGPNIHQMRNETAEHAITVHIYGFDSRLHDSSVHREYALAQG